MMFLPHTHRTLLAALALAASALLAFALAGQYALGWHPCHLCLLQRYPYAAMVALGGIALMRGAPARLVRAALFACVLLLAVDAGIAFYHTGVEQGWFAGPSGCTNSDTGAMTIEEMRAAILNAPLVTCDQAVAHVFGLSLAAWNAFIAAALAVFAVIAMRKIP